MCSSPRENESLHFGWYIVRAVLGLFNAYCMICFRDGVAKAFGRNAANWYAVFQASQFHMMYYASRTLPNSFAFGLGKSHVHPILKRKLLTTRSHTSNKQPASSRRPPPHIQIHPPPHHPRPRPPYHDRHNLPLRNRHPPLHLYPLPIPPHAHRTPPRYHHPRRHPRPHPRPLPHHPHRLLLLATPLPLARTHRLHLQHH